MAKKNAANIINIDGKEYNFDELSDNAKMQIMNLRTTEQEIARTQALLSMLQTARAAYASVLKSELEKA